MDSSQQQINMTQLHEVKKDFNETEGQYLLRKKVYDNVKRKSEKPTE